MQIIGGLAVDTTAWEAEFIAAQDARVNLAFGERFTDDFDAAYDTRFPADFDTRFDSRFRGEFNVARYGAVGDGITDDTVYIQAAIDAAEAYVVAHNTAATVKFPPGLYLVSSTLRVKQSGVSLEGVGISGDDWTPLGSCLIPSPSFANDTYVLAFDWAGKTTSLYNNRLLNLNIIKRKADTFANTVHGIYWGVSKGLISHVHVQGVSGRGLGIQGCSSAYKLYDSRFIDSGFRHCGTHGIESLGQESDNWFARVKSEGNFNGSGLCDLGANNYYTNCHFTGNKNNVTNKDGGTESVFLGCNFETPSQHNVCLDVTNGPLSRIKFIGCQFNSNRLDATNTWDAIYVGRTSGTYSCEAIVSNCTFAATDTNLPRYHINLSGAAAGGFVVDNNTYSAAGTGNINHNAAAVRCLINGLGKNVGIPSTAGAWFGRGEEGVRVVNTSTNVIYSFANGAWR